MQNDKTLFAFGLLMMFLLSSARQIGKKLPHRCLMAVITVYSMSFAVKTLYIDN